MRTRACRLSTEISTSKRLLGSPGVRRYSHIRQRLTYRPELLRASWHISRSATWSEHPNWAGRCPLFTTLCLGGLPLILQLARRLLVRDFGSDLLAGIAIVASLFVHQYLVGSIIVLMLSGGTALEHYAVRRASSVLEALARRMPRLAHRRANSGFVDVSTDEIAVGDTLIVLPHETCPVDGVVVEGHSTMDESYLTGEPFQMAKVPGSEVLSGGINGDTVLTIRASRLPVDSRYARIVRIMEAGEQKRPKIRRLADRLGASYTVAALGSSAQSRSRPGAASSSRIRPFSSG